MAFNCAIINSSLEGKRTRCWCYIYAKRLDTTLLLLSELINKKQRLSLLYWINKEERFQRNVSSDIFCTFLIKDLLQSLIRSLDCDVKCMNEWVNACIGCSIIILTLKHTCYFCLSLIFSSTLFIKVRIVLPIIFNTIVNHTYAENLIYRHHHYYHY